MNRRNNQQNHNAYERILEIKKRINKSQTQFPLFLWHPLFMYNVCLNFNFIYLPPGFQQKLKFIKPRKLRTWIDDIPILVGVDEFEQIETCAICLQELNEKNVIKILKCNHFFHQECIKQWLQLKAECPTCRDQLNK
ncbi:unnamed protein product [Paramecium primaurelia]|uniref:RING-type domain-containing protein n=2 Tax=Paramecium TaxID=5884 RepID=A0A8S1XS19_9CILI|nr:unnamed protein product [Paramecium primaurelia]CAD8203468.1 unnamed protein product [Paramecium pentaurelia]